MAPDPGLTPDPRGFSIVLFMGLVVICASLFYNGKMNGGVFALCVVASAIAVILLGNANRLESLLFRQGDSEVQVSLQKLKDEVYAKVDQLQRLAQGIASFTAASVVGENRFAREDHHERMLRRRDELEAFLAEAGIEKARIDEVVQPITIMVDWDLRKRLSIDLGVGWKLKPGEDPGDATARAAAQKEINAALQQADRLAGLAAAEKLVREKYADRKVIEEPLQRYIDDYRRLITSGRLPKSGPVDDLTQAPDVF